MELFINEIDFDETSDLISRLFHKNDKHVKWSKRAQKSNVILIDSY
jgi:hypothetical protein